jgi:hypothetical protein
VLKEVGGRRETDRQKEENNQRGSDEARGEVVVLLTAFTARVFCYARFKRALRQIGRAHV